MTACLNSFQRRDGSGGCMLLRELSWYRKGQVPSPGKNWCEALWAVGLCWNGRYSKKFITVVNISQSPAWDFPDTHEVWRESILLHFFWKFLQHWSHAHCIMNHSLHQHDHSLEFWAVAVSMEATTVQWTLCLLWCTMARRWQASHLFSVHQRVQKNSMSPMGSHGP